MRQLLASFFGYLIESIAEKALDKSIM